MKKFFSRYRLSPDLKYSALNQISRISSSLIIVSLLPFYLTLETQGYWFTFTSVGMLVILADLGFTVIILQFSAHEFAHLSLDKILYGPQKNIEKISSLFNFSAKWSLTLSLIIFPIILVTGLEIMSAKTEYDSTWVLAWVIYSFATILTFLSNIILSFIEGCNSVANIQKIKLCIAFFYFIVIVTGLTNNFGLLTLSLSLFFSSLLTIFLLVANYRFLLLQLIKTSTSKMYNWGKEIFPLLKKYAISEVFGYLVLFIFTPLSFYFYGAGIAGKVGLSIAIFTATYSLSYIWLVAITPRLSILASKKELTEFNNIFLKNFYRSMFTFLLAFTIIVIAFYFFKSRFTILEDRFMDLSSIVMIGLGWFFQLLINSFRLYVRSFKLEIFYVPIVFLGISIVFSTIIIGYSFPHNYFFVGYLASYALFFILILYKFNNFKASMMSNF